MRKLNGIENNILKLYKENQDVVNDDALLTSEYWKKFDGWVQSMPLYWNLQQVTPSESVTRARRKLHELDLVKYSTDADKARERRYVEMRDEHGEIVMRIV